MKIPFERTIVGAYRFAFANFLSIVGIGWFPVLLLAAITGGLFVLALPLLSGLWLEDQKTLDQARLVTVAVPLACMFAVIVVAGILVQAMISVGIMRKALGLHPRPVFIFFSLGGQVWRLVGSYLLVLLLFWGATSVVAALISASFTFKQVSEGASAAVDGVLVAVLIVCLVYAAVRLTFFIPAVVVAENHIGLSRSWRLARGNFWRIVGVGLIVTLPIAIAASTIWSTVAQAEAPQLQQILPPRDPAAVRKYVETLVAVAPRVAPIWISIQAVYIVLIAGLSSGAIATAYRAVTGGDAAKEPA